MAIISNYGFGGKVEKPHKISVAIYFLVVAAIYLLGLSMLAGGIGTLWVFIHVPPMGIVAGGLCAFSFIVWEKANRMLKWGIFYLDGTTASPWYGINGG